MHMGDNIDFSKTNDSPMSFANEYVQDQCGNIIA